MLDVLLHLEFPSLLCWFKLHLVKDGIVAFSDAGSLRLSSNCYLDDRLDVYARQLSALNDTHTDLHKKLNLKY